MSLTDAQLMQNIAKGDASALEAFSLRFGGRFFALAYRFMGVRDLAEDALQEFLIKVWQNAHKWDEKKGSITTWGYRILTNICLDMLKKHKYDLTLDEAVLKEDEAAFKKLDERLDEARLIVLMKELPRHQRLVLILCYVEGFSQKEVSEIMGMTVRAVESLLRRSKKSIKEKLLQENLMLEEAV